MLTELLVRLVPSRTGFLSLLAEVISDEMLRDIAAADYGCDVDEHFRELQRIRDQADVHLPLKWHPSEVLELIRWSEPDDPSWKPGGYGERGHLMRAFCCCALLIAGASQTRDGNLDGENQTLAQLLDSLRSLDAKYLPNALQLISYRLLLDDRRDVERPFFILALLWIFLRIGSEDMLSEVGRIVDWLLAEQTRILDADWAVFPTEDPHSLLGLTFFDLRHRVWISLADELGEMASKLRLDDVRIRVEEFAEDLINWTPKSAD